MTAEEFLDDIEIWDGVFVHSTKARKAMIEFAKFHVKEALKESEKEATKYMSRTIVELRGYKKDLILNSYPLENIK